MMSAMRAALDRKHHYHYYYSDTTTHCLLGKLHRVNLNYR